MGRVTDSGKPEWSTRGGLDKKTSGGGNIGKPELRAYSVDDKMKNTARAVLFAFVFVIAAPVLAADSGPSLPDGPVPSPPGWSCTASGGAVVCVRIMEK